MIVSVENSFITNSWTKILIGTIHSTKSQQEMALHNSTLLNLLLVTL